MKYSLMVWALLLAGSSLPECLGQDKPVLLDEADPKFRGVIPRMWMADFSYDDSFVVTAAGGEQPDEPGELIVWNLANSAPVCIRRQTRVVRTAVYSPDGEQLALGDFAGTVALVDPKTGKTRTLTKHASLANSLAFTHDSQKLISGSFDGHIKVIDLSSGQVDHDFEIPGEMVVTIAISTNDQKLAAATWQGNTYLFDLPGRKQLHKLVSIKPGNTTATEALAFAPDEEILVTGSFDRTLRIWNANTGEIVHELQGHKTGQLSAAYSPDGNLLATVGDLGDLNLWNPQTGELIETLKAHPDRCTSVSFSSNGDRMVTTSWDRTARVWETESRKLIATLARKTTP